MTISPPTAAEFPPQYGRYISQVPASGPMHTLDAQRAQIGALQTLSEERGEHRYADGKWSVKEVLGHVADAERVFCYRLLRIARADATPLAGFDENQWAAAAPHHGRRLAEIVTEFLAVRGATLSLIQSLDGAALDRSTIANGAPISGRALCWAMAGHTEHHLGLLYERYGVPPPG
jgi:hypothetical protein